MRLPGILIIALLALPAAFALADEPVPAQTAPEITAAAVESFLDGYLPETMATRHIPGLVITVVKGSTPLVTKGYGVADIKTGRKVNPQRTLFDVQSISKLIVSTAVMIARDEGDVRLNVDINHYLKGFRIPETYAKPITLASLMTHTSGLEDRGIGITARTPRQALPLGTWLERNLTRRVAPPFTDLLYSDEGMSLAAYTIQSATDVPYKSFVQHRIFDPLAMNHTFFFSVPPAMKANRSSAYSFEDGKLINIPHYYYNIWPTSSLWTTAADMGHFIAMQLDDGVFDGKRILSKRTIGDLHTRHFSYDPRMPGVCFDFFEHFENGHRLLIHSGGGSGFASELMLMPAEDVGYFLSYNGYDGSLIAAFRSAFLDRFYPAPAKAAKIATVRMTATQLVPYDGWYWSTRYDRRTIGKLSSLLDGYLDVSHAGHGLVIGGREFSPVTATVFVDQEDKVPHYVAFRRDASGRVSELLSADAEAPYHRVPWFYSQPVQLALVATGALGFAMAILFIIAGALRRGLRPVTVDWTRSYFFVTAAGSLVCLVLLLIELVKSSTPSGAVSFELGLGVGMRTLIATLTLFALASLVSPIGAFIAWRRGDRPWALLATAVSLTAIGYVWFLHTWNILYWSN